MVFLHSYKTSQDFEWAKRKYVIKKIKGYKYIVPQVVKKKLSVYKPDFAHICEVLMSWDFNDEERILEFVNRYGLLGIYRWLTREVDILSAYNTLAMYHEDKDWIRRFNGNPKGNDQDEVALYKVGTDWVATPDRREPDWKAGYMNFDTETAHKWDMAFGILREGTQVSNAQWINDNGDIEKEGKITHAKFERTPYAVGRGISNNKDDQEFWKFYREPMALFQYTATWFKRNLELFTASNPCLQPFAYRPSFVPLGKGKTGIAIESLIEGAYAYATLKMIQGVELKPCTAIINPGKYSEEDCPECRTCEYRYFWLEGTKKREYGIIKPTCKPHNRLKQSNKRSGAAKKIPQRGKRKECPDNSGK